MCERLRVAEIYGSAGSAHVYDSDCIRNPGNINLAVFDFLTPFVNGECPTHDFVQYWENDPNPWRCGPNNEPLSDAIIIEEEGRLRSGIQREDEGGLAAERLLARGLSVDFLVALTFAHNLWAWKTSDVVLRLVKPATEHRARRRFADLPEVQPFVGNATVFMSHSWAGRWGDLVAAAAVGARGDRIVWRDIFAVRQWPGNTADLNFRSVVQQCKALIVVAPPLGGSVCSRIFSKNSVYSNTGFTSQLMDYLESEEYATARLSLPFSRLWCIVEFDAAKRAGVPILIQSSKADVVPRGANATSVALKSAGSFEMLCNWLNMVDVERAGCSVSSDFDREMTAVRSSKGGAPGLTRSLRSSLAAAVAALTLRNSAVDAFVCGEHGQLLAMENMESGGRGGGGDGDETRISSNVSPRQHRNRIVQEPTSRPPLLCALEAAAAGDHVEAIRAVLGMIGRAPSTVTAPDSWVGALAHAAFGGHAPSVEVLLDAGVDPNMPATKPGQTQRKGLNHTSALCAAASGGHGDIVNLLLHRGALADGSPGEKESPLYCAAEGGHEGVVSILLEAGAHARHSSTSPLHGAVSRGHVRVVEILMGCAQIAATADSPSNTGQLPAMLIAATLGQVEVARALLAGGASPEVVDANKTNSAMREASLRPEGAGVLGLLLEAGADPNLGAPICIAAECGVLEIVKVLLKHRADPNRRDNQKATPLFHAAREGFPDVVTALLAAGADPSLECWGKKTPLQAAEGAQHTEVVIELEAFARYRERVLKFYTRYNPEKLCIFDEKIRMYQEDDLMEVLIGKYGPEP